MSNILAVGVATLDIISLVKTYPEEDSEIRALTQRRARGGNAANTLVILSQLGHAAHWAGVLPQSSDADWVAADLQRYGVCLDAVSHVKQGSLPVSHILLSQATGSRSIVHYRNLPEYSLDQFKSLNLAAFDWVHFEGRNVPDLGKMLEMVKRKGMACSLEVEKPREGMEKLFHWPDVLLFSRNYVQHKGFDSAESFLQQAKFKNQKIFVSWGEQGAWAKAGQQQMLHCRHKVSKVVDSVGAGDVFNAGVIHGLCSGQALAEVLNTASHLAAQHCARQGFDLET